MSIVQEIVLSERNLKILLSKLQREDSACTIIKPDGTQIRAETDAIHYKDRKPGCMHDVDESNIKDHTSLKEALKTAKAALTQCKQDYARVNVGFNQASKDSWEWKQMQAIVDAARGLIENQGDFTQLMDPLSFLKLDEALTAYDEGKDKL